MLVIRAVQIAALEYAAAERFAREVLPELKEAWPSRCVQRDDRDLIAEIATAIRDARGFGVRADEAVLEYLHILFLFGRGFPHRDDDAWARSILTDAGLADILKIIHLRREALARIR